MTPPVLPVLLDLVARRVLLVLLVLMALPVLPVPPGRLTRPHLWHLEGLPDLEVPLAPSDPLVRSDPERRPQGPVGPLAPLDHVARACRVCPVVRAWSCHRRCRLGSWF